jgi:hypothetical protein
LHANGFNIWDMESPRELHRRGGARRGVLPAQKLAHEKVPAVVTSRPFTHGTTFVMARMNK